MASKQIVLIDLPSQPPCRCWSLNPWKVRLLLNYKGIDYRTQWTEYPDLKATLEPHCPPPPERKGTPYTAPTVIMPDGTYITESLDIAKAIEKIHPEPSIHLDSPYNARVAALATPTLLTVMPEFLVKLPERILNPEAHEYFYRTREGFVGMSLADLQKAKGGEKCFKEAEPKLKELTAMLKEHPEGPWFGGKEPCYGDFEWLGVLRMMRCIGKDLFEPLLEASGDPEVHLKLLEAAEPYLKRDDH